jgi:hypothetical protein
MLPLGISNAALPTKVHFRYSISLFLLCFFITFLFQSTLPSHHKRLDFYTMTLNDECKITRSFSPPRPYFLTITHICLLINALCFLGRSDGIATNIGFLGPGPDGHGLGLGIGLKKSQSIWGRPSQFFLDALT